MGARHWQILALLVCLPTLLPLGATLFALLTPDAALWAHLLDYVLPEVTVNTLWLLLGVGSASALLGTPLPALVALCEFPGRRLFGWALLLPLAMPGYVLAIAFIGLFDYAGPLATALRGHAIALPEIRSRGGVIAVLSLTLYPYVYLLARQAFASQGLRALEAGRALGLAPFAAFRRVALPLARPWIAGGVLLVLMETLADFGTVAAFNYDTFTTAIYKAWFALFSLEAALQIAAVMLLLVLVLIGLEARTRARQRYTALGPATARRLALGRLRWPASAFCAAILVLAFVLPVLQLGTLAWPYLPELDRRYLGFAANSAGLGLVAAALTTLAALLLAQAARAAPGAFTGLGVRLATLGYALPGALLAVGLYVPLARGVGLLNAQFGWTLALQGGLLLLLMAYGVRFMAVAHAPVAGGFLRIRPSMLEACRLLGVGRLTQARRLYWPLLRGALFTATLLVFVDVMKEMPITLMTRPFGWDTLATRVFELTSEGEHARAAVPALGIVIAGLLPVWLLNRGADRATAA
jgi:iron(III) transport system permease protein